ncbi:MAG TPA: aminopeptidase P family protein [Gammaproteobacteria bacterium]|nr:aminopeptidase P family protein [Gammaproteobacteria bacterium]
MTNLHFPRGEYDRRLSAVVSALDQQGLHGVVLFRQESMYYLSGYDTSGYTMFQAMYLGVDGRMALLTRSADRIQSRVTSIIPDIRIWTDREEASPAEELRELLRDYGCENQTIGIEYHAYGLTGQRALAVNAALQDFCTLVDASDTVRLVRLVKSNLELDYVRQAGTLCDEMLEVSIEYTQPGNTVKSVYGAMMQVLMTGGGDPSASRWPMGAGESAVFCRYHTGDEIIQDNDQVIFEPAAAYRHYHACMMYNIVTGDLDPRHQAMHESCVDALESCQTLLRAGNTVGELYAAHANAFQRGGYTNAALAACGYSVGISYPPTWMDWPMIWAENPQVLEPGMVFFMHMILLDDSTGLSMCLGETAIVTEGACERVNHMPRDVIQV